MKTARLAVGAIAIAAGGGALLMFGRSAPPPAPQIVQAAPTIETEDVLVAARDITLGTVLSTDDFAFQAWPRASVTPPLVRKSDGQAVLMSTMIGSGMRAVAINIDSRGSTSAGGFILPNDHVDIINTYRDSDATKTTGGDIYSNQVLLTNIKVLAIGPNIQEKNGERVVIGETAEIRPRSR